MTIPEEVREVVLALREAWIDGIAPKYRTIKSAADLLEQQAQTIEAYKKAHGLDGQEIERLRLLASDKLKDSMPAAYLHSCTYETGETIFKASLYQDNPFGHNNEEFTYEVTPLYEKEVE